MTMINKDYLYTKEWSDLDTIHLLPRSLYLFAHDPEDRSMFCANGLTANNLDTIFVEVSIDDQDMLNVTSTGERVSLCSLKNIEAFLLSYSAKVVYIEVTGMSCRLVAPLMRCALSLKLELHIVYSEPKQYLLPEFKKIGVNQDLSEACAGVNPLPGFARILPHREEPIFVALLGFEGGRLSYLISMQQPATDKICPIIGVPGYQIDYPYESYWGNRNSLRSSRAWERVSYAEANSIVDSYLVLGEIFSKNHNSDMIIAPIGTKPHAIGAILYAIKHPDSVELLYDNPKRSVHRTDGIGRILECNVTKLINEN